jgi:acetyl-CoA carboxylase carboxyltransferase component
MSWQQEVAELNRRKQLAEQMGGAEGVARQKARGKLNVRERIDAFADKNSFREFMGLVGAGQYEDNKLVGFTPKPQVEGTVLVNGRKVVVRASDFSVRGGAGGSSGGGQLGQELPSSARATEWRLPFVRLLDAAGGSVRGFEELGRTYLPDGNIYTSPEVKLLSLVPVVSAVLGSVAGLPAIYGPMSHFSVMVKDISHLFPGGPPVVKAALGYDISKEELGGDQIHVGVSGCIDNLAEDEGDAFEQIRRFLSYLPSSVDEMPPRGTTDDPVDRTDESLLSFVPRDRRRPFDGRKLIPKIVDRDSFFEIAPRYGRARITGLARLNGYPVGIMANNPMFNGGATDVAAGSKVMRLIQLCNTFHLPLISLADEPGFQVGLEAEKQGIERAGARLVSTICLSEMPWCTVVVGRLYGVAGQCHHRPTGMFRRYCWPSASWGSMHISGGAAAAYKREIESSADPEAKRKEIEARLNAIASPFRTAEATGQDIIDPRETRALLCEFVEDAQRIIARQLGRPSMPYLP